MSPQLTNMYINLLRIYTCIKINQNNLCLNIVYVVM